MPKSIYEDIYKDLKMKIEDNTFAYQELLPSENTLIQTYGCSRNTLRRAVSLLVSDGYVQTMQGKGVRNIYRPNEKTAFTIGEIETFKESAARNGQNAHTEVALFTELCISKNQSAYTGFPAGAEVYYIQRIHYLEDIPLIINHNYFLKESVPGLTAEIARGLLSVATGKEGYFDYGGCLYPQGLVGDQILYFNHRDIVKVVFSGFHDDDDKMMVDNINQWYMESPYERTDVEKLVRERGAQDGGKLG